MTADNEKPWTETAPDDRRAFNAAEMVPCPNCSRPSPPTRINCLYCGADLGIVRPDTTALVATATAEPEQESLQHVIVLARELNEPALSGLAKISDLTIPELTTHRSLWGNAFPICAVDSTRADLIRQRVSSLDLEAVTVDEKQMKLDAEPTDLRTLVFKDDSIVGVSRRSGEQIGAPWAEVSLIVVGRLQSTRIEVDQKKKRGRSRTVDERAISSDEALIDIYLTNDDVGWRIRGDNFDFSCLGKEKSMTAFQNFAVLTKLLKGRARDAMFDEAYNRSRAILAKLWPAEPPEDRTERRRDFHATVRTTTSDNLSQFTRYSRLRRLLKQRDAAH